FRANDPSRQYLAEDWGRNILGSLKPGAIIVPSADHSTFPLLYLQAAEGFRPDVLVANKYGTIDDAVFRELLLGKDPPRVPPPRGKSSAEKERYLVQCSGRPVYFTTKTRLEGLPGWELEPWGLVFEAVAKSTKPDEKAHEALWASFRFREGSLRHAPGDFSYDLILADYHYARARWAPLFARLGEACSELELAARHGRGIKEVLNNLGGTLAEAGKPELALRYLRQALEVDPEYDLALKNLASAHFALKRYREGLVWFERALELEPRGIPLWLGKARGLKELGLEASAYEAYLHAWRLSPRSPELREEIEAFARKLFGETSSLAKLGPLPEPRTPGAEAELGYDPGADLPGPAAPSGREPEAWEAQPGLSPLSSIRDGTGGRSPYDPPATP
ncbi:MAG: tetratricopeptide repeat protein, partial [Planctomycetes bacterium]|nr:tetratricopeptide repeat protein [Planctomycetota bacterium]